MDRANLSQYYAQNVGLVHQVARRGHQRLLALGAPLEYDDVFQELSAIFVRSYELFDPEQGRFSTYFMNAAYHTVNKIADKVITERVENRTHSIQEMDARSANSEGGASFAETIASSAPTPEEEAHRMECLLALESRLSPVALMIVSWLIDPPDFVEREFQAQQAHAELGRSRGLAVRSRREPCLSFVCDMLIRIAQIPKGTVRDARAEVQRIVENPDV